jgi:hypothetical protein
LPELVEVSLLLLPEVFLVAFFLNVFLNFWVLLTRGLNVISVKQEFLKVIVCVGLVPELLPVDFVEHVVDHIYVEILMRAQLK